MDFTTKEDLIKVLKQDYARNGVVLSIKRSNSTGVILKCDLGGSPNMVEQAEPKRKSSSRLIGCEFQVRLGSKKGCWFVKEIVGTHNHPVEGSLIGHPGYRRLDGQCKERIKIMVESGTAPKDILTNIKVEFINLGGVPRIQLHCPRNL
jgi:hypothetical protein